MHPGFILWASSLVGGDLFLRPVDTGQWTPKDLRVDQINYKFTICTYCQLYTYYMVDTQNVMPSPSTTSSSFFSVSLSFSLSLGFVFLSCPDAQWEWFDRSGFCSGIFISAYMKQGCWRPSRTYLLYPLPPSLRTWHESTFQCRLNPRTGVLT